VRGEAGFYWGRCEGGLECVGWQIEDCYSHMGLRGAATLVSGVERGAW
jgi:hypothetical protein